MSDGGRVAAPPGRGGIATRLRAELGPPPQRDEWPPVSIVVVNRDGRHHLELLLERLAGATDYPRLELVLVDNASSDGSVELVRAADLPFPLVVIENDANLPFAEANDDGVERAAHDLVLLLNNDVEPFEPGWLKELVDCLEREGAAAAGATLLHGSRRRHGAGRGYVLQHRGIELVREAGSIVPFNSGDGDELRPFEAPDLPRPACTAACLLLRRAAFERVGGFTGGFLWGWEDVDLGLKLSAAGERVTCSGRAVAFHHESSTRGQIGSEWSRRTRRHNQRLFMGRWGPQTRREYLLDRIDGRGFWTDRRPPRLVTALSGDPDRDLPLRQLGDAIERLGWQVEPLDVSGDGWEAVPVDTDLALVAGAGFAASLPRGVDCVAWVSDPVADWLDSPLAVRSELTLAGHPAVASALAAAGVGAVGFPGAVDPDRPPPAAGAEREVDCLVLAEREDFTPEWALALARRAGLSVRVAGPGWHGPAAFGFPVAAGSSGAAVAELAATARLVVHQRAADGVRGPADSGLLFEALVAGALPLSDDAELVDGLLGAAGIPTWRSADELERLVGELLGDEPRRRELVERGAALVRAEHTWPRRAELLLDAVRERTERARFCLRVAEPWGADPAAVALKRGLELRGHACAVQLRDEWQTLDGLTADVAVVLGPGGDGPLAPAQLNVLRAWEGIRPTECDAWDLVLVPDADVAADLGAGTPTEVVALDLAAAEDPAAELLGAVDACRAAREVPRSVLAR